MKVTDAERRLGWSASACLTLALLLAASGGRASRVARCAAEEAREEPSVRGRPVHSAVPAECTGSLAPQRRPLPTDPACPTPAAGVHAGEGLATLAGRITRAGQGTPARILFALGPNEGLAVETSPEGEFRRSALVPGFQLVTVAIPGRPACTRSLFLPPYGEHALALDFGAPASALVCVTDGAGQPVAGAEAALDGVPTTTDSAGRARLVRECSGPAELVVKAPGFAWFACAIDADSHEPLEVRLEPACTLELRLPALASAEDGVLYVLPRGAERLAGRPLRPATPWYLLSPRRWVPGATVRFENLPAGEVEIHAFHRAGRAHVEHVLLDPEHPVSVELTMCGAPLPEGALPWRELVSSAVGLGTLPRLQPLAELPCPRETLLRTGPG